MLWNDWIHSTNQSIMKQKMFKQKYLKNNNKSFSSSNGRRFKKGSKDLVHLRFIASGKIITLLGGGGWRGPLNTAPGAGALEITALRVSEIASAILIMSPPLIPYVHWQRERKRERESSPSFPNTTNLQRLPGRKKKKSTIQKKQPSSTRVL